MDFHAQLASMQPALCGAVDYTEIPVGSMMALITEQEQESGNQFLTNPIHGAFNYYSQQPDTYIPAAFLQAAQTFNLETVEPQSEGLHFSLEQFQTDNGLYANGSVSPGKSELVGKIIGYTDGRKQFYVEPSGYIGATSPMPPDTRASASTIEMDNKCATNASDAESLRAKISSHPQYPRLVVAYTKCQKVGAPPEIAARLEEVSKEYENSKSLRTNATVADAELDHFMDTYCNLLTKYHEELNRPFKEAMAFFRKIELQLSSLNNGNLQLSQSGYGHAMCEGEEKMDTNGSSEEDVSCGELEFHDVDPLAEDKQLKEQLLRKYSGYICTLKQEFLKKKKKGKLPKDSRQKLLDWWCQHYKWPYPTETEKSSLAQSTGLDQKQINNWFINQRKRHWKPSEDMQYVMVESPGCRNAVQHTDTTKKTGAVPIDQ
eukprot:c20643_g2_i2 orf=420-1715(+)